MAMQVHFKKKKILKRVTSMLGPVLFLAALWLLEREIRRVGLHEIMTRLQHIPPLQLVHALAATLFCYWLFSWYDVFSLRYARASLPYSKIVFASSVSSAFNNTISISHLAGSFVRYRIYSSWNLSNRKIAEALAVYILSNWLGFLTATGAIFLFMPPKVDLAQRYPFFSVVTDHFRLLGILFFLVLMGFLVWRHFDRNPIPLGKVRLQLKINSSFLLAVGIGCLDFSLTGIPLYCLLPRHPAISYIEYVGIYLLATTLGIISHVPGGIGVFETVIFLSMGGLYPQADLFSTLLIYRMVYYFLPLSIAAVLLFGFEWKLRHKKAKQTPQK